MASRPRSQSWVGAVAFDGKQWTDKVEKVKQRGNDALASLDAPACQDS